MKESKRNLIKYAYIALGTFAATKLVGGVCWLFSIMLILSLLLAGRVLFEVLDKKDITIKRIVLSLLIVLIFMGIGIYHRVYCHNAKTLENPEAVVECEDEDDKDCTPVQDIIVNQEQTTNKKAQRKTAPSPKDISDKSTIKEKGVDYTEAKTTTGTTTNEVSLEDDTLKEEKKITEEAIKEAEEEGKTVTEHDSGIITIVDNKEEDKKEEDKKEEKPAITEKDMEEAEKIYSEESGKNQEAEKLEEKKDEYVAANDDELDELEKLTASKNEKTANSVVEAKKEVETKPVTETKTEKVETVTEEVEISNEPVVETIEAQEVEITEEVIEIVEPVVETIEAQEVEEVEPEVEVIEAQEVKDAEIKVTAIDGYEGFVNSDIQFRVEGDNITVEGLEGTDSNYNPATGMLTINSAEATIVTVELTNSTSNVTFDVTINGIVR